MSEQENPWIDIVPGIRRRTICTGATMFQMRAELAAGSRLPEHVIDTFSPPREDYLALDAKARRVAE